MGKRFGAPIALFIAVLGFAVLFMLGRDSYTEEPPVVAAGNEGVAAATSTEKAEAAAAAAEKPIAVKTVTTYKTVEECHDETVTVPGDDDPDEDDDEGDDEDDMRTETRRVCVTKQVPVTTTVASSGGAQQPSAPLSQTQSPAQPKPSAPAPAPKTSSGYTLAEVAKHAARSDCWMAISGKVYNITPYFSSGHPGGAANLSLGCGKDATSYYTSNAGAGHAHSSSARSMLAAYYIGDLK